MSGKELNVNGEIVTGPPPQKKERCSYPSVVSKYPCVVMWGMLACMFGLTSIGGPGMRALSEQAANEWSLNDHKVVEDRDAYIDAKSKLDEKVNATKTATKLRENAKNSAALMFLYNSESSADIFNPKALQEICKIEQKIVLAGDYDKFCRLGYDTFGNNTGCKTQQMSAARLFYGAIIEECPDSATCTSLKNKIPFVDHVTVSSKEYIVGVPMVPGSTACYVPGNNDCPAATFNFTSCPLLDQWKVDEVRKYLYTALTKDFMNPKTGKPVKGEVFYGFYMDVDTLKNKKSTRTRSSLGFGTPLNMAEKEEKKEYEIFIGGIEEDLFDKFDMKAQTFPLLKSAYRFPAVTDDIKVEWISGTIQSLEFGRLVNQDFTMPIVSVLLVWMWIGVHTGMVLTWLLGMSQIMLSLPCAFFFYKYIFQIPFFSQMHILSVFLVLGVGADDVFVFVDAWKQSGNDVDQKLSGQSRLQARMKYAYDRTFSSVFNTSFTTAMAFVSTGINPLVGISTFGWFAATAIGVNYLFVITFTPAVVLVDELYVKPCLQAFCKPCPRPVYKKCCTQCCYAKFDENKKGLSGRCLSNCYKPLVLKTFGGSKIKPFAIIMVLLSLGYGIQAIYFTSKLTPPTQQAVWFPDDHMMTGLGDRITENYLGSTDDGYAKMEVIFGIKGVDREATGFVKYKPDDNRGIAVYDTAFDLHPPSSQKAIIEFCDTLEQKICKYKGKTLEACKDANYKLVRAGLILCPMKEFQVWHNATYGQLSTDASVTKAIFDERMKLFRDKAAPKNSELGSSWTKLVGVIDGKVKYLAVQYTSTLVKRQPLGLKEPVYLMIGDMVEEYSASAPTAVKTAFQYAGEWIWMVTEKALVESLMQGLAISFPMAFAVLLFATGNFITSTFATVGIGFIVVSVLGFCKAMMNWDLGIAESIAGIIVIGFAVDYVVHLGHMYTEAAHLKQYSREERFAHSIDKMGGTVIAGAITTILSGAVMWICQVTFFTKMAYLIVMTIVYSFIFSLSFFMPVMALLGPQGEFGDTKKVFSCFFKKKNNKVASSTPEKPIDDQ